MRVAKFDRAFGQPRRLARDAAEQSHEFYTGETGQFALSQDTHVFLLAFSRDHRGLHAEAFAPGDAACIACDRNVRGGVLRSSHLLAIAAPGAKWPDEGSERG